MIGIREHSGAGRVTSQALGSNCRHVSGILCDSRPLHYYIEAGRGYAFGGLELWEAITRPLATGLLNLFTLSLAVEAGMRLYCYKQPENLAPSAKEVFLFIISLFILIFVCFAFTLVDHYVNRGTTPPTLVYTYSFLYSFWPWALLSQSPSGNVMRDCIVFATSGGLMRGAERRAPCG
jgi:hypothetical protein